MLFFDVCGVVGSGAWGWGLANRVGSVKTRQQHMWSGCGRYSMCMSHMVDPPGGWCRGARGATRWGVVWASRFLSVAGWVG